MVALALACSASVLCVPAALAASGHQAYAWGLGPLGDGTSGVSRTPVVVNGVADPVAVARGAAEGFALMPDGTIQAWGDNVEGELGDGSDARARLRPVQVAGIRTAISIAAGDDFGVAVLSDGSVDVWGDGSHGNLGNGSVMYTNKPTSASVSGMATAVAAGWAHVLALMNDGSVQAWGYNADGQLGNGNESDSDTPIPVPDISTATAVAAGFLSSYALLADGTIESWGQNHAGALGNGTPGDSSSPVKVYGISNATAIAAGGSHCLALLANGTIEAWGDNTFGQLGDPAVISSSNVPVPVPGLTHVVTIAAGFDTSYALRSDGTVWAWGDAGLGALGAGSSGGGSTPVEVADLGVGADTISSSGTADGALAIAHPVAELSPPSLAFGTQPQDTIGPPQGATLTNIGASGLEETFSNTVGPDPDDFIKSNDSCVGQHLASGASCQLHLRFAPSAAAGTPESASLVVGTNTPSSPLGTTLSGTAGPLPQGPAGQPGAPGLTGSTGPPGPRGQQGLAGRFVLVTCRAVAVLGRALRRSAPRETCTVRTISGPLTLSAAVNPVTLSRRGLVYATGVAARPKRNELELVLTVRRRLTAGRYTLVETRQSRRDRRSTHRTVLSIA